MIMSKPRLAGIGPSAGFAMVKSKEGAHIATADAEDLADHPEFEQGDNWQGEKHVF